MTSLLSKDKKLFTPGPLNVNPTVRAAMNHDLGSRDTEFVGIVKFVQQKLIEIAGLSVDSHTCVLMQGSGTYSVEATLQTTSDKIKKVLILSSGAYGIRMGTICKAAKIPYDLIEFSEDKSVEMDAKVLDHLASDAYAALALVHCETSSGIVSPIEEIGLRLKADYPNIFYIVDAMSSFGGIVANYDTVDFLISSANKCIEGVPGCAFVICKKDCLRQCKDRSVTFSLDLYDQWVAFERNGQFRFTPPTHCILALKKAIEELEQEGGVDGRARRYKQNNQIVKDGMKRLGFSQFVLDDSHIIASFNYPKHPKFNFEEFYYQLSEKGQIIYPGKTTKADCFRIGNIGHLFHEDIFLLLKCIEEVLNDMKIVF